MMALEMVEKFCRMYSQGNSLRAIAEKEKVSPNTVKKYLLINRIPVKQKNIIYCEKQKDDLLNGAYCGIWAGDGTQYKDGGYRIKICCDSRNLELMEFFQKLLLEKFGKKSSIVQEKGNRAFVRFNSKYIFNFVNKFLIFGEYKTKTVCLKNKVEEYSDRFIIGFILGLTLTDGCLKSKFQFTTISTQLAKNAFDILEKFQFNPRRYIQNRAKYGWNDLHNVYLNRAESVKFQAKLDTVLKKELRYGKGVVALKVYEINK